jgi:uncharacterized membrane protein YkvA (DUF1232 family)
MHTISISYPNKFKHSIAAAFHIWRDARLPVLARILFLLALLYVFVPCDWLPDASAIGYVDDFAIVVLIAYFLQRIIPKVILQDARRAAAGTACGILCLNLFAPMNLNHSVERKSGSFSQTRSVAKFSQNAITSLVAKSFDKNVANVIANCGQAGRDDFSQVTSFTANSIDQSPTSFGNCQPGLPIFSRVTASPVAISGPFGSEQVFLCFRGGKGQVYSSNGIAARARMPKFCRAKVPSPACKDGIFFDSCQVVIVTEVSC